MAGRIEDAIGGFNTLLDEQRKLADPCTMTLVQFDNQYDVVCTDTDLANVPNLTKATFVPRGSTALLDAIGKTIDDAITRYKNIDKPERVLFIIVTDGEEANCRGSFGQDPLPAPSSLRIHRNPSIYRL